MATAEELISFLKNGKAAATTTTASTTKFHIVIGNESADLDSVVSSIAYAFYSSKTVEEEALLHIPVVAIPAKDLVLRTEVIALFKKLNISASDVIHLNEVDFSKLSVSRVTLVDHNNKAKHLQHLSLSVTKIIDHHEDSGDFNGPDLTKIIKTVGSCATLIAEEIYYARHPARSLFTYPLAELLYSAVLIDTYNLDLHSGRTTELDVFIGELLSNHYTGEDVEQSFFDYLQNAKTDISSMATYDILRKDYKPVASITSLKVGISSVTMESLGLLVRDDILQASEDYSKRMQLDVLVIMFLSFNNKSTTPCREISVFSRNATFRDLVCSYLMSQSELHMKERADELSGASKGLFRLFDQNPKLSRKFVLPILQRMS